METEQRSEEVKVEEPRTEEESSHASSLLDLVLVSTHTDLSRLVRQTLTQLLFHVCCSLLQEKEKEGVWPPALTGGLQVGGDYIDVKMK